MTLLDTRNELRERWRVVNSALAKERRDRVAPTDELVAEADELSTKLADVSQQIRLARRQASSKDHFEGTPSETLEARRAELQAKMEEDRQLIARINRTLDYRDAKENLAKKLDGLSDSEKTVLDQLIEARGIPSQETVNAPG